ncbi:hypothetical protein D3C74_126110 [compost metagenome]
MIRMRITRVIRYLLSLQAGGYLFAFGTVREDHHGRLEFLQIPGTNVCVVAIHDYVPSLPWFIYKYTQAKVHLGLCMRLESMSSD